MSQRADLALVATCAPGLEPLLEDEVRSLDARDVRQGRGAVSFRGDWRHVWRANLWLRTANRVLVELGSWPVARDDDLAAGASDFFDRSTPSFDLFRWLTPERSFSIRATTRHRRIRDSRWVGLRVKDGLVDRQRELFGGQRSSVDRQRPDLPFRVLLEEKRATLLLDSSREPLDRRGYRIQRTDAPVREQLAAAMVLASGWTGDGPVVDPMCGSGTLLAEAGWIALGRPPGALRKRWVFEDWPSFDRDELHRARLGPSRSAGKREVELFGADSSEMAIGAAKRNLEAAGLAPSTALEIGDAFDLEPPPGPGLVLLNPPYGERAASPPALWPRIGDLLKQKYRGYTAVVLAGDADRGKFIGLRARRRISVRNGPIDARILVFELF